MKIAILQANLNNFDKPIDPVKQDLPPGIELTFHRWTDENFPPITGLTPRFQYRIPKLFGWQMLPDYDYYIWLDGGMSFERPDCVAWFLDQLDENDIGFFKHPNRRNIRQEVEHIEEHLNFKYYDEDGNVIKIGKPYITSRYKNGLHREQLDAIMKSSPEYKDRRLYASTAFIYRNTAKVRHFLTLWWLEQSRYFTCDQVVLPYLLWLHDLKVTTFDEPIYKSGYLSLVSKHN